MAVVLLVAAVASMQCVPVTEALFPAVRNIYAEGLATGNATFETEVPSWLAWDKGHHSFGRIGALGNGELLGWAALSPVSKRAAYQGVAEVSIYVAQAARAQGVGKFLLKELIVRSESNHIWTLQSSVFPSNQASIELHKRCGFRVIGYREKVAQLNGTWHDNVLLERRSAIVGK